jgi:hypothetical protein
VLALGALTAGWLAIAPAVAHAEATGAIAGKLTFAEGGAPVPSDEVCAERVSAGSQEAAATCAASDAAGEYLITGLPTGAYRVAFTNNGVACATKRYDLRYVPQWYDHKRSGPEANLVQVMAPSTTGGIDASILTEPQPRDPVLEYVCNEENAKPISEGGGILPGAIEPAPGNKRLEEEFWANPPWKHSAAASASAAVSCPPPAAQPGSAPSPPAPGPPSSPAASAQEVLVACVGSQPVTLATFQHWSEVASAAGGLPSGQPEREQQIRQEVMQFLLSSAWVFGEAQDRGVHVSASRVHREFERLRKQQFPKRRELTAFERKSKETLADLLMRVRLQLLARRLSKRVAAGHHGARARERALTRYVEEFRKKWLNETYCAPQYAVADCGHVQATL